MPPFFSFIVPIYNASPYLRRCLESIRLQSFSSFEAILVDDGSTDTSGQIADEFAAEDPRFKVFHQPNLGTSEATNAALSAASGSFLINLDNDDYVDRELLAHAKSVIDRVAPDIIQYLSTFVASDGTVLYRQTASEKENLYFGHANLSQCELEMPEGFNRTHSRKVFRRNILNGIVFKGTSKGADTSFLRRVLFRSETIAFEPKHYFYVRVLTTSESRKPNPPYLYREWFDRLVADIDFCIEENKKLKRTPPFWEFCDTLDMLQMYAAKAINEKVYDPSYFRSLAQELKKRKYYLFSTDIRSRIRTFVWLTFTKKCATCLAKRLPREDFIV